MKRTLPSLSAYKHERRKQAMTRHVQFLLAVAGLTMILAACNRPMLGFVTETYVNQDNANQTLELRTKETVKGFIAGRSSNPFGGYTLSSEQKTTAGEYTRDGDTYVLKSKDNQEFRMTLQKDWSLQDESGKIWRFQSRSRRFHPPDDAIASR